MDSIFVWYKRFIDSCKEGGKKNSQIQAKKGGHVVDWQQQSPMIYVSKSFHILKESYSQQSLSWHCQKIFFFHIFLAIHLSLTFQPHLGKELWPQLRLATQARPLLAQKEIACLHWHSRPRNYFWILQHWNTYLMVCILDEENSLTEVKKLTSSRCVKQEDI